MKQLDEEDIPELPDDLTPAFTPRFHGRDIEPDDDDDLRVLNDHLDDEDEVQELEFGER